MFEIFSAKDPQKALQRAHELVRENKIEAAIDVLEDNLIDDADSFDLFLELARLYYEIEERGRAVELLHRVHGLVPSRTDEVLAVLSELFRQHTSIDAGDFLLQLYTQQQNYDEIGKILSALNEHELRLLIKKYEKVKPGVIGKGVIVKGEFESMIILASLKCHVGDGDEAASLVEPLMAVDTFKRPLLAWSRITARERYGDSYAALMLLRSLLANDDFEGALTQAQRIIEKFPEVSEILIDILSSVKPPPAVQPSYTQMMTDLYITRGDLATSIDQLRQRLEKDTRDIDVVIKDLRKLERANPKDLKILYTLADAYMRAKRIPLAINELDKILGIDANQYDDILRRYLQAWEQKRNDPVVIQGLVNLYLKRNDVASAADVIDTVYRMDPGLANEYILNLNAILDKDMDNVKALRLLGQCYARKGDREIALLIFQKLMDMGEHEYVSDAAAEISEAYPQDVDYVNLRASSLIMFGRVNDGLRICLDYLELEPDKTEHLFPSFDLALSRDPKLLREIEPLYVKYRKVDAYVADLALARAHAYAGAYRKAVSGFEKCLKKEDQREMTKRALIEVIKERPTAVPLLLAAARIFIAEGQVEIATQFLKTANKADPQAFFEVINDFYDAIKSFPKDREARTLLVDTFYGRGLWDKTIEESRYAIEVLGSNVQYFNLKLGQALVETGKLSEAVRPLMISLDGDEDYSNEVIEGLDRILKTDKANVPAHFARGRALSRAGRIDEAVDEYLHTAKILPARAGHVHAELKALSSKEIAHPKIMYALGMIEMGEKNYEEAADNLMKASELDISFVPQVIPMLERLQKRSPSAQLAFSLGRLYSLAGQSGPAIEQYVMAQSKEPKYREPVIAEIKRICADNPGDIDCRKRLAEVYFTYHNWEDILVLLEEIYALDRNEGAWIKDFIGRILEVDRNSPPPYYLLSRILLDDGAQEKAVEVYAKLVETAPTEIVGVMNALRSYPDKKPVALLYLGDLYLDGGYGNESFEAIEQVFSIDPSRADAIAKRLERMIQKYPEMGDAHLLQSRVRSALDDLHGAVESVERALQLMPGREDIVLRFGQLLHEAGDTERAIEVFSDLLRTAKDRNTIYRLIKAAREDYYKEKISVLKGDDQPTRLERAHFYLMMDRPREAGRELKFEPDGPSTAKRQAILKARLNLKRKRPIDALEIMQTLPLDKETAEAYADVYEAMGSFGAAALALRQSGIDGMEQRINFFEKLAQDKRATRGKYFVEGRT